MKRLSFLPTLPSLLVAPGKPFIHRDMSWLLFNERVLNEARDPSNPTLERLKFLGITASNLDEFFMIRYPALLRSISTLGKSDQPEDKKKLRSLRKINSSVQEAVSRFGVKQADTLDLLMGDLSTEGIQIVRSPKPLEEAFSAGKIIFEEQILPHLQLPEKFFPEQLTTLLNLQICAIFENGN